MLHFPENEQEWRSEAGEEHEARKVRYTLITVSMGTREENEMVQNS